MAAYNMQRRTDGGEKERKEQVGCSTENECNIWDEGMEEQRDTCVKKNANNLICTAHGRNDKRMDGGSGNWMEKDGGESIAKSLWERMDERIPSSKYLYRPSRVNWFEPGSHKTPKPWWTTNKQQDREVQSKVNPQSKQSVKMSNLQTTV